MNHLYPEYLLNTGLTKAELRAAYKELHETVYQELERITTNGFLEINLKLELLDVYRALAEKKEINLVDKINKLERDLEFRASVMQDSMKRIMKLLK